MEKRGRIGSERGKKVWLLKTREGKLVDSFRTKVMAEKTKEYYYKEYSWDLFIERKRGIKNEDQEGMSRV